MTLDSSETCLAQSKQDIGLLQLSCGGSPTRDILMTFAEDYYRSATPIMMDREAGELFGSMLPALAIAAITGNPELVPAEVTGEAGVDIAGVASEANDIAETLEAIKHTKTIEQAQVDQLHKLVERPEGVDVGAVHISQAQYHEPNDEIELQHPAGEQYNLPAEEHKNFSGAVMPKMLRPGTKIYHIVEIDESGNVYVNGRYWSYELPEGLILVRKR